MGKFPVKRSIAVLLVALTYVTLAVFVGNCKDIFKTQTASGKMFLKNTAATSEDNGDEEQVYTSVKWWKAGISDYSIMEKMMAEPVNIEKPAVTTSATTSKYKGSASSNTYAEDETVPPDVNDTTPPVTSSSTTTKKPDTTTSTQQTTTSSSSWGTVKVKTSSGTITGDAYDIVCKVVQNEVGSNFSKEAIKAQAVATYTYIKYYESVGSVAPVSMNQNVSSTVKSCVSAVKGKAIYYGGSPILSMYYSCNSGKSADNTDVFGKSLPYLTSVESKYDSLASAYKRTKSYSQAEVKSMIEDYYDITLSSDPSNWIKIKNRVSANLVGDISIDGNKDSKGKSLRAALGLRSACFDVSYSGGVFTFTTYGYGHMVGMSQYGANYYATKDGWNYIQILQHYYKGATVK